MSKRHISYNDISIIDMRDNTFITPINNIVIMSRESMRLQALKKLETRKNNPMKMVKPKKRKKTKSKGKKSCH